MAIRWDRRSYTAEELETAWRASSTITECMERLGKNPRSGGAYRDLTGAAKELGLDKFDMQPRVYRTARITDEEFFTNGRRHSGVAIKRRMLARGIPEVCDWCGLGPEWNGKVLVHHVDHIDGDPLNNVINNLRFLCPNCHSQTDTYCGKNKTDGQLAARSVCIDCGAVVSGQSTRCLDCHRARQSEARTERKSAVHVCQDCGGEVESMTCTCRTRCRSAKRSAHAHRSLVDRAAERSAATRARNDAEMFGDGVEVTRDVLADFMDSCKWNFCEASRRWGISDVAIRRRCGSMGLPVSKAEIREWLGE